MTSDHARRDLMLVGGGEHARVIADAAARSGVWRLVGYADPVRSDTMDRLGLKYLGSDDQARTAAREASLVVAIGGVSGLIARRALVDRWAASPRDWAVVIHPSAVVSPRAVVEEGVVVLAGAIVNPGARIGAHTIVNTGVIVEHDVVVGRFSHIAPGAVIGGGARIGEATFIGLGARVRDHITIGDEAVVGMGAVVVQPVGSGAIVMGVPARSASPTDLVDR